MNKKIVTSIALASLLALPNLAKADPETNFTPVENLSPEDRKVVIQKFLEITDGMQVDWDNIIVGVDDTGNLLVKDKSDSSLRPIASSSCFGGGNRIKN